MLLCGKREKLIQGGGRVGGFVFGKGEKSSFWVGGRMLLCKRREELILNGDRKNALLRKEERVDPR